MTNQKIDSEWKNIRHIIESLNVDSEFFELYGSFRAKIRPELHNHLKDKPNGKYIIVTGIPPTQFGEGKTTTAIGLSMALNRIHKSSIVTLRQPSLAPLFGIKGTATGGGLSQVGPYNEISIKLASDIGFIEFANNLLVAAVENSIFHNNKYNIDMNTITLNRVSDISDRALRSVRVGLNEKNIERDTSFETTSASELMAICSLATSCSDLKNRIARMIVAKSKDDRFITADDLKITGAIYSLLEESFKPNLVQTCENTPAFLHTCPPANIAHGNSSIIADLIALKLSDYVVTEAGFGAELGFEKFINIKCRAGGLFPDIAIIVCSIRALKLHSGKFKHIRGIPLDVSITYENVDLLREGLPILKRMIEIVKHFGIEAIVALNKFATDTEKESDEVIKFALNNGAYDAVIVDSYKSGSGGALGLAESVIKATQKKRVAKFSYSLEESIKSKIEKIATQIYGADGVSFEQTALEKIENLQKIRYAELPICIAKTQFSISHNAKLKGIPKGFIFPVNDVRLYAGAGFITVLSGKIKTMTALPSNPLYENFG